MTRGFWVTVFALALLGVAACAHLLGIREAQPREFEHRAHALEGISCVQCHAGIEQAGEDDPLHIPGRARCVECHEKPHNPSPCSQCHGSESARRHAAQARKYVRFRHDQHLQKMPGKCVRCHTEVAHEGGSLAAPMGACLGCHEHEDEFRVRDCEGCHVDLVDESLMPESHFVHDSNFLQSHGVKAASAGDLCASCHQERFCTQCHGVNVPQLPSRMDFDRPLRSTMHRANFDARHSQEARAQPGLCATCHSDRFCRECHVSRGVSATGAGAANPHPPGWVGALGSRNLHGPAARRDPVSCASCHGGAGEQLCVECHRVGGIGGSPHPPGWNSRKGKADMPCRLCHMPVP